MYMYTSYIPDFLIYKENVSLKGVLFLKKYLCKSYLQRLLAAKQDANSIPFFFHVGLHLKFRCTHVPSNESVKRFVPPWEYLSSGIYCSLVVIWTINQTFQRVVTCQKTFELPRISSAFVIKASLVFLNI